MWIREIWEAVQKDVKGGKHTRVLFDMDGLMFDTERISHRGWKYGAQVLEWNCPDEVIAAGRGMSVADSRAMYLGTGPEVDYDALRALRVAYADEAIARDGLPVKPGLQLLEHLRAAGIPAAFGNGHCAGKGAALFKNERRRLFEATVCGDEVACKTGTGYLLAAAKALGVPAEECLVLEDSPNGLRAARAAGCKAVVVPDITPIPPESEGLWAACGDACGCDPFFGMPVRPAAAIA